jgi:hypothetical protein
MLVAQEAWTVIAAIPHEWRIGDAFLFADPAIEHMQPGRGFLLLHNRTLAEHPRCFTLHDGMMYGWSHRSVTR